MEDILPAWACMWTLALAIYAGAKGLTWSCTSIPNVPLWRHLGYLLAWPGLDAVAFLDSRRSTTTPLIGEWLFAVGKLILGLLVLFVVVPRISSLPVYLVGWVGMIGIALVLHFGVFHLLSCFWRWFGVDARPLMNWPLTAASVIDYWGRRWNTAFRDLTHRFVFRPLTIRVGPRLALTAVFLFSGLVHDAVISLPAGAGYGGPTVFFLVQAAAIFFERSELSRWLGLGHGVRGWLFTMFVLLAPAYLLFHAAFVETIVVPFLHALGALG